jgi:peptidoglycan/LPS O-acetylase OafA/YrhL
MKLNYRPEIDGLRALAVGVVILYHSNHTFFGKDLFSGGFIGVDIFFVISGYLISSLIFKELITTGSFSFKYFYERRIRRILPALYTIIVVSIPFAWMFILPIDLVAFTKSIISSLFFGSNFFFHFSELEYGTQDSLLKPLLHTWSLSVEEQFYILFPLIFIILFYSFKKFLGATIICGIVISLIIAEISSKNFVSLNFYFIHSRIWELLAGSLIAYYEIFKKKNLKDNVLNKIYPSIGLLLIVYSIISFNDTMRHPSLITIIPVAGTIMIIAFSKQNEIICKLLSQKFIVQIGLISYSLYLWHYPIFAFSRITDFSQGNIIKKILLIILIFILSIVTYKFIEKPARNRENSFKKILFVLISFAIIILFFCGLTIKKNGLIKNHPEIIKNSYKNLDYRGISQDNKLCHSRIGYDGFCIFNQKDKNSGNIILLGDSITDAMLADMIEKVKNTDFKLIHMSYSGNLYFPEFLAVNKRNNRIDQDERYHAYREKYLNNLNEINYIIIAGNYSYFFEEQRIKLEGHNLKIYATERKFINKNSMQEKKNERINKLKSKFKDTVENLAKKNKIILLYPIPQPPKNVWQRVTNNYFKGLIDDKKNKNYYLEDKINFNQKHFFDLNQNIFNFFDTIKSENIHRVYPHKLFCDIKCFFYDDKNIYFFDKVHPSKYGSSIINSLVLKTIEKVEKKN